MKPSIGRIVHVTPGDFAPGLVNNGLTQDDPVAAIVTRVWDDGTDTPTINVVAYVDARGGTVQTSVQHVSKAPVGSTVWAWPERV